MTTRSMEVGAGRCMVKLHSSAILVNFITTVYHLCMCCYRAILEAPLDQWR